MTADTPRTGLWCAQNSIFLRENSIFPSDPSFSLSLSFSIDSLKNSPLTAVSFYNKSIAPFRLCPIIIPFFHLSFFFDVTFFLRCTGRGLDCLPRWLLTNSESIVATAAATHRLLCHKAAATKRRFDALWASQADGGMTLSRWMCTAAWIGRGRTMFV